MKFSYTLLKKLVPEIKSKKDAIEKLNFHVFEAESLDGDSIEIKIPPNRFSSCGGHLGIALELSAIYSGEFQLPTTNYQLPAKGKLNFSILVKSKLCRRIMGQYFENLQIKESPRWLQKVLTDCGLHPINNIVDITNYVMLETGQPLHAFDYDKLSADKSGEKKIIVRPARQLEEITALDGQKFNLNPQILVIADKEPLDIAGIKGGKKTEIDGQTKKIILTAANFDGPTIYKTSRQLGLITDASARNAHNLTPALIPLAMRRAGELIKQLAGGEAGKIVDIYQQKARKVLLRFDLEKINRLLGVSLKEKEALNFLERLGFIVKKISNKKFIEAPFFRDDIGRVEDLADEIIRLKGLNNLSARAPQIILRPSGFEEEIVFKDKIKDILVNLGLDEVYNYSFNSVKETELSVGEFFGLKNQSLANPLSADFEILRSSLAPHLLKNLGDNFRFSDDIKIFEIGQIFLPEKTVLGMALGSKAKRNIISSPVLELKGLVDQLLEGLGLVDRDYLDLNFELDFLIQRESLRVESDHHVLGYLGTVKGSNGQQAIAEIDLGELAKLVEEEKEYEPLAKFPSIMRDISLLAPRYIRVNQIMEIIENSAPKYLDDVDLIDFYEDETLGDNFKSLTFRLIFLANDRTLTDEEVDKELQKITSVLISQLGIEVR